MEEILNMLFLIGVGTAVAGPIGGFMGFCIGFCIFLILRAIKDSK